MSKLRAIAGVSAAALVAGVASVASINAATAQSSPIVAGNTSLSGATADHPGAGYKGGSVFQASTSGTYTTWEIYASGGNQSETVTPAVYQTQNGQPTGLLATGSPVVIAAHQGAGWITSPISASLTAGNSYWIGMLPGAKSAAATFYFQPSSNAGIWNKNSNIITPDSWFLPVNYSNQLWDVALTMPGSTGSSGNTGSSGGSPTTPPAPPTTQPAPPTTQPAPPTTQPAPPTTQPSTPTNGSVGSTSIGGSGSSAGAGYIWGNVYNTGANDGGAVSSFRAYVAGGKQAQVLTPVIYQVANGAPSTLLATGTPFSVAAGQKAGWVSSSISTTFANNTQYFLGLLSGGSSAAAVEYSTAGNNTGGFWTPNKSGWSTPDRSFAQKNTETGQYSFNVVVSPAVSSTSAGSGTTSPGNGQTTNTTPPTTTPPTTTPPTTTDPITSQSSSSGSCSSVTWSLNWCGWTQKVSDTFANDGGKLNSNIWWPPYNCGNAGCGNAGVGVRSNSLLNVSNGALNIGGESLTSPKVGAGAMMGTNWLYGKFEVTASVDGGSGTGPAILLMTTGTWPQGGELDMMESPQGPRTYYNVTDHFAANNSTIGTGVACTCTAKNTWDLIWEPGQVTEYLNGTEVWQTTNPSAIPTGTMNLAVQMDPGPNGFIAGPDGTTQSVEDLHVYNTTVWQ